MHFEFLVEDASGCILLGQLLPKILGPGPTYRVHAYKGIGHVPAGLSSRSAPDRRILLDQLPRLLRGYGNKLEAGASSRRAYGSRGRRA